MAEYGISPAIKSDSSSTSGTGASFWNYSIQYLNLGIHSLIPPYSIITDSTFYIEVKRNGASSSTWDTDIKLYIAYAKDYKTSIYTIYQKDDAIGTSYKAFSGSIPTKYFYSGTANAGNPNGWDSYVIYCDGTLSRTYTLTNPIIRVDYIAPTFVISLTAGTGGTVSGGGTYNVVGGSATIKATPNANYRFVKWSDGNTNAERTITVSESDISANVTNLSYTATFELITYNLTVNAGTGGAVSGGGTYTTGSSVTISATPKAGYKFVKWSDGNTSASRTVTVTANATYTATFIPIFVSYDSIFSFSKWKEKGITAASRGTISNITNTGFSMTASGDDAYTVYSHIFPVVAGKTYTLEYEATGGASGSSVESFVFFHSNSNDYSWSVCKNSYSRKWSFTVPDGYSWASIRVDANITGETIVYNNFRIYPSDYDYMGSTLSATDRSDIAAWSVPTPTRSNYTFLGWYTQPNGGGTKYTASSTYPSDDLTLYSSWKINTYTITTSATNGTVTGGGTYDYGSTVTLTATANRGYKFLKWSDGVTTATRQVTVTGNATYTAVFMVDKIIADTSFAKKILIDTSEVKAVYIDTVKVYG